MRLNSSLLFILEKFRSNVDKSRNSSILSCLAAYVFSSISSIYAFVLIM